jgi:ketol-acid reductoisomerase
MIAPKSPGHRLRELYTKGVGVPALVAIHQDASSQAMDKAMAYAKGLGSTRAGVLGTTFQEETETDLFGEQTVLCGGVTSLVKSAFEILIEAGYQPEIAYFEVFHELKLIVDLLYQGGMDYMRYSVSDTAEYGDYTRGPRVVNEDVKDNMRKVLKEIQNGTFAKEWIAENDEGRPRFNTLQKENADHPIEKVGKILREQMPWLKDTV